MLSSRDKVQSGQRWEPRTAAQHNAWTDAAQAIAQINRGSLNQSKQALEYTPIFIEAASTIPPGTVVGFGNPNLLATSNETAMQRVVFDYATPAAGRWAVAQKGIGTSEFEECVLTGVAWAQVNVTDASHTHADIDAGSLKSATSGYAKILYKPAGTGTNWCCLQLGLPDGGGSVNCSTLHTIHNIPDVPSITKYVPVYATTGQCENVEIVECGTDATPPCSGCTGSTPTYYLLSVTGASLSASNPSPTNSFDIPIGNELLMQRTARCAFQVTLEYTQYGAPDDTVDVRLSWDPVNDEWVMDGTDLLGFDFTPIAGPLNCNTSRAYAYSGDPALIPGYDLTGMLFTVSPRVTVL